MSEEEGGGGFYIVILTRSRAVMIYALCHNFAKINANLLRKWDRKTFFLAFGSCAKFLRK